MLFNLHAVIGCHCAVKRDCIYHVLTPLPVNNLAQVKIDLLFYNHSQSSKAGNELFYSSLPFLLVNVFIVTTKSESCLFHAAVLISVSSSMHELVQLNVK